jgi:DNA-binding transcriptional MerR regulator
LTSGQPVNSVEEVDMVAVPERGELMVDSSRTPGQGALFEDPMPAPDEQLGYRGPTACAAAGITYRQLDYWARTDLVVPTVRSATGSGTQRLYSFKDILVLKVVKRLLDTGVSLHNIRRAVDALRSRGVDDLARITLLSDGTTVYECTSAEEIVDLLRGGQGVFGIAVSGALRELIGDLVHLPGERADGETDLPLANPAEANALAADSTDELARRRERRSATA